MSHIHDRYDFVVTAFLVHEKRVLLVHHKELDQWLPVGGHIELDEDPDEALFREIEEETGLTPDDIEIMNTKPVEQFAGVKFLFTPSGVDVHPIDEDHYHIALRYIARAKTDKVRLAEREHHAIAWVREDELDDGNRGYHPAIRFYAKEALRQVAAHEERNGNNI